jgi:hypothetical protein
MARARNGHLAICAPLRLLHDTELAELRAHLLVEKNSLRTPRYGRLVVAAVTAELVSEERMHVPFRYEEVSKNCSSGQQSGCKEKC